MISMVKVNKGIDGVVVVVFFFLFFPYRTKATNKHVVSSPESCQQVMCNMPFYSHLVKEKKKNTLCLLLRIRKRGGGV
jgi:hypothetical protein